MTKVEEIKKLISLQGDPPVGLAPMFEVNDLAFRLLCRKYGVKLCWTGMVNAHNWATQSHQRKKFFETCPEDRPLIIQISGNNTEEILACAKDLEEFGDAIDINLGCTQHIAKRGKFGYFAINSEDKRENVIEMVQTIAASIKKPLTIKLRIIDGEDKKPDPELTKQFAQQLEKAGAAMISIHGRQKNSNKEGEVDIASIKLISDALTIPVFANGGVKNKEEAIKQINEIGCTGAMIGQGLLVNPRMFSDNPEQDPVGLSKDYIELWKEHPFHSIYVARRHIYYFFQGVLRTKPAVDEALKKTHTIEQIEDFIRQYEAGELEPKAEN